MFSTVLKSLWTFAISSLVAHSSVTFATRRDILLNIAPLKRYITHVPVSCCRQNYNIQNIVFQQKSPTCILCGIRGHIQRDCPGRPCPHCGLPSHGLDPCRVPPVWKQHCQRCGAMGHLTDVSQPSVCRTSCFDCLS